MRLLHEAFLATKATYADEVWRKVERTIESWIFHHADFIDFDIAKFLGKRAR